MGTFTWQEDAQYFSGKCSMVLVAVDVRGNCRVCLTPKPPIEGSVSVTLQSTILAATGEVG